MYCIKDIECRGCNERRTAIYRNPCKQCAEAEHGTPYYRPAKKKRTFVLPGE